MRGLRFRSKIVLLTGGTSGVGQAISEGFAAEGGIVIVFDEPDTGYSFAEAAASAPGKIIGVRVKLTNSGDAQNAVARLVRERSRIDILVNNYRLPFTAPFLETKEADWYQDIEHNLVVAIRVCHAVLPFMVKAKSGTVVNVGSIAGRQPRPVSAVYASAMAGIIEMTRSLAVAMSPHGIRVNGVCAGVTDDPVHQAFVRAADPAFINKLKASITLGRWGKAEEVAAAALFLATEESSYIVGQSINVDGGNTML